MRKLVLLCFFLCSTSLIWSQKKKSFFYRNTPLTKVLSDVEKVFAVKYSYVDSLVVPQRFSVLKKAYSLTEINIEIEKQTSLKVIKINDRFYSINQTDDNDLSQKVIPLEEIIVEEFLAKGIQKVNQYFVISPQKVQTLPGLTDADVLLSVQQLPGVKSPNETATGLHIRGGTPDQNLILWDGIRLYHPGHLFGMISCINPNVEQTVNYYNKAVNSKFGERVSGIIDIKSTDKILDKTKVNVGINALNADMYVQTPLIKNKLGLQLSGRKSFTEWWQSQTFNQLETKVFQNTNFEDFDNNNQFKFHDYSAKLNFKPNDKSTISITGLVIQNDLDYRNIIKLDSISNQKMSIDNYGFSLNWTQKYSSKFSQKTVFFYSLYSFDYLKKQDYHSNKFEAFKKLNRVVDSGAEMHFSYLFNEKSLLEFGYQTFGNDISHLFNSFNQDIGVVLSLKQLYNITHSGYVHYKQDLDRWNFLYGLRYSYFNQINASSFEPRLLIQRNLSKSLIWQASYEKRSQIVSQVRENAANDLSLENYVWVLSNNNEYPIQRANQFTSGLIFKKNDWLLDVDVYYKNIKGITTFTLGFLGQNDNEIQLGNGFTKGIDVLLQKSAATWRAWLTYTYQDTQNRFSGLNNENYFSSNADIRHSFNMAFNKKWNQFLFTAGWFWHSGKPFSTINEAGAVISYNQHRLPNYHRMDISGSYQFQNTNGKTVRIGVSVYNLYNRNVLISRELIRNFANVTDFITPRYSIQDFYSLGIMPNIFLRINF
jgi:hypothetical protein